MVVVPPAQSYTVSAETLTEVERVFRNMEFFESRRPELGAGSNPPDTVFFEEEKEAIVADGISLKEMSKKRLNRE
jgi:hypothetical protein